MYSIADSTVAAFEFAAFASAAAEAALEVAVAVESGIRGESLIAAGALLSDAVDEEDEAWQLTIGVPIVETEPERALTWGEGRRACISFRASLMRFRRPCSAILCEVRLEERPLERESG